jgi:hypothetical protein
MRSNHLAIRTASTVLATVLVAVNLPPSSTAQDFAATEAVEALFMGAGKLTPSDGFSASPFANFWSGFPRDTTVTVRVSKTVPPQIRRAIQQALRQVPPATNGAISTVFQLTDDPNPIPDRHEVTLAIHPDPVSQGCPFKRGCTMHDFDGKPGIFASSRAVQPTGLPVNAYVHDLVGHGIMGMCHIDGNLIGGAANSLMSGGPGVFSGAIARRLTTLDIEASKAVYSSNLDPGATRKDFIKHRLIGASN